MSWTSAYRLALHLLPATLRRKHGPAMEALFAREVGQARARGWPHGALTGAAGLLDVLRRGAYEQVRPVRHAAGFPGGPQGAPEGEPQMPHVPPPTTGQILGRHAASFAVALAALTTLIIALYARKQIPALSALRAEGLSAGTVAGVLWLAVPFTVALTIPMAVFVAVLHEFARLQADGTLAAARRRRGGVRRLVGPVLAAAVAVAALTLVSNTVLLPRANERLASVLAGRPASATSRMRSDREMTISELRTAARRARAEAAPQARAHAAVYEVEVQKKYALAAACVVLALVAMAVALAIPHVGRGVAGLVVGVSGAVFGTYYVLIMTGESLAEGLVVSPVVGMWGPNAVLLGAALLALLALLVPSRRRGGSIA